VSDSPLWRQAFDAVEKRVTPPAEQLVRTPGFSVGVAVVGKARSVARGAARGVSARAWHLLNLPAGSDVSRLRSQVGALDREVRRLTVALENERRRGADDGGPPAAGRTAGGRTAGGRARRATPPDPITPPRRSTRPDPEERHADGAQPSDGDRPRPARRRAQRPAGP
jgi:hypothetical protein